MKENSSPSKGYSESFYASYARQYAEVAHEYRQSVYIDSSHPRLKGDLDLQARLKELMPKGRGLDAGCGSGARDVYAFWSEGYDMWGIDSVEENIQTAREWHPEIKDWVFVHDLRKTLPFKDGHFDFVMCNAVIQHIDPQIVHTVTIPELVRVIRPGGILQLMFKCGSGTETLYDKDYDTWRCFQLFEAEEILNRLGACGMELIEGDKDRLGGVMWFVDPKNSRHSVMLTRKKDLKDQVNYVDGI